MKNIVTAICLISFLSSWSQDSYSVLIDLTSAKDDRLPVSITVPAIDRDTVEYHMAKIVPGSYKLNEYGRFVKEFVALDVQGEKLNVTRLTTNRWQITNARKLKSISYWVEDSFDDFEGYGSRRVFEPSGTGFDKERDVFVINTFGLVGYIDGNKFNPYNLEVRHPENIYGATSLQRKKSDATTDTFVAENFNFLADGPILYCEPDTVSTNIAGANIMVAIYSPNDLLNASDVMDNIKDLMVKQAAYLGGDKLPVDRYAYLIYLFDDSTISGAWGALEHSYSSLFSLPEMDPSRIAQSVRDVAAHEFLHIVTPLNIHSEEIHDFNYIEPRMSQHLWLYEGVTEYASHHLQVKHGLYELDSFIQEIRGKILASENYGVDLPYTEFSANILDPENEARYLDVYAGGALIAMCLDLTIIQSTEGTMDLQGLIRELSKQYGPFKAFKDEELFDEIERLSTPEVGEFLRNHVGKHSPLPLSEVLEWAGIEYTPTISRSVATTGRFGFGINENEEVLVRDVSGMNEFGKEMGFQEGDVFVSWNGRPLTLHTANDVLESHYNNIGPKDKVKVVVRRMVDGEEKEVKLKAKSVMVESTEHHVISVLENPTAEQLRIRNIWLTAPES